MNAAGLPLFAAHRAPRAARRHSRLPRLHRLHRARRRGDRRRQLGRAGADRGHLGGGPRHPRRRPRLLADPPRGLAGGARASSRRRARSARSRRCAPCCAAPDGEGQALVELKAVDAAYPHGGSLVLEGGGDGQALLAARDGIFGALVAPEVLDRLGLALGDRVMLGETELELRDVIRSEPDRLSDGIGFGPRADRLARRAAGDRPGARRQPDHLDLPPPHAGRRQRHRRDGAAPRRGAGALSGGRLEHPLARQRLAEPAPQHRALLAVPDAGRPDRAGRRRRRRRQCGGELRRPEAAGHRHAEMPRRAAQPGLPRSI